MPTLVRTSRPLRAAALAATAGLALASTAALAPGAAQATGTATARQATAGPLHWGYKTSFRTYIAEEVARGGATGARSSITPSAGATFDGSVPSTRQPAVNKAPYVWPLRSGTVNPSTGAGSISYGGKVTFAYPAHFIQSFALSNPRITFDGRGGGAVYMDVAYDTGGGGGQAASKKSLDDVKVATLTGAKVTVTGNQARMSDANASLTKEGSDAVNGFSAEGEPLDSVSFTVTLAATSTSGTGGSSGSGKTGDTSDPGHKSGGSKATPSSNAAASSTAAASASASASASAAASASGSASASSTASPGANDSVSPGATNPGVTDVASTNTASKSSSPTGLIVTVVILAALAAAAGGAYLARRRSSTTAS